MRLNAIQEVRQSIGLTDGHKVPEKRNGQNLEGKLIEKTGRKL